MSCTRRDARSPSKPAGHDIVNRRHFFARPGKNISGVSPGEDWVAADIEFVWYQYEETRGALKAFLVDSNLKAIRKVIL